MVLRVNIYIYLRETWQGNYEESTKRQASALAQSLAVGSVCIVYRFVWCTTEMKAGGAGSAGVASLWCSWGRGLPLRAITGNTLRTEAARKKTWRRSLELRSLVVALKNMQSIETINGLPPVEWS